MTGKRGNFPQLPTIFQLFPTLYNKVTQGRTTKNRLTSQTFCKMLFAKVSYNFKSENQNILIIFWGVNCTAHRICCTPCALDFCYSLRCRWNTIIAIILFVILLWTISYINCVVLFWLSYMIFICSFNGIFYDILVTHQVFPVSLIQYSILLPDLSGCWPFHVIFGSLLDNLKILFDNYCLWKLLCWNHLCQFWSWSIVCCALYSISLTLRCLHVFLGRPIRKKYQMLA